jgi:hypothetical protein
VVALRDLSHREFLEFHTDGQPGHLWSMSDTNCKRMIVSRAFELTGDKPGPSRSPPLQ